MIRDEAIAKIREAQVGRLATVRPDGSPHVVPFVFVLVGKRNDLLAYWVVDAKPKKRDTIQRIKNIEANPMVEFVVDGYEEDWSALWWVRAMGRARSVTSEKERRMALAALSGKYPQYATEPPNGPVIAIEVERVTGWSAADTRS